MSDTIFGTEIPHSIDLILHQCNQRRNNYRSTVKNQRRQLITKRLPSSGRHQYKCIIPGKQISDNRFLISLKCIESEIPFQFLSQIYFFCHTVTLFLVMYIRRPLSVKQIYKQLLLITKFFLAVFSYTANSFAFSNFFSA